MKFLQLRVLSLVTILLLTLQSCQKDTLSDSNSYTIENRTRDYGVYNSYAATRPVPAEYPILAHFPQGYWEISEVAAAAIKYDEIFKKLKDVQQYGDPVWAATLIRADSVRSFSITPLLDSEDELINFYIFEKHLVTGNSRFLFVSKNNNLPGFNQNGFFNDFKVFERRRYNSNQQGCYNWGSSGGFLNKLFGWVGGLFDGIGSVNPPAGMGTIYIPWIPLDAPGSFGTQTNGSTFGGASGNNGYTYPNGGIGNSDLRVKTAQGCKDFIEKSWGISVQTTNLQEKIDKCGCTRAVFMNSEYWNENQNNGKLSCLACYNSPFASHYVSQLVDIFKNIKFPCQKVIEADKNKMIDDALGDICERNYYNSDIYPGVILQRFTNELNNKDLTYYAPSSYMSGPMNALALASLDIVKMGVILGINQQGVTQMSDESICTKTKVAECLEGGIGDPGGLLHYGKKEVLDFYKAHNPLKHPCSYSELNLDNTVLQMCASNSVSMDNLEAMLEGNGEIYTVNITIDSWQNQNISNEDLTELKSRLKAYVCLGEISPSAIPEFIALNDFSINNCFDDPTPANINGNIHDNTYINRMRDALQRLRNVGYGWFSDLIQEMIDCNEFQTVGDLQDTWKLVKEFVNQVNDHAVCAREQYVSQMMMEIFSPSNVGVALGFVTFGQNMTPAFKAKFRIHFASKMTAKCSDLSKGFYTFNAFKNTYGAAGQNKAWHHIVEQNTEFSSGFNPRMLHHPDNLVKIEGGFTGAWHNKITGLMPKMEDILNVMGSHCASGW